jgi:hypothetical protein
MAIILLITSFPALRANCVATCFYERQNTICLNFYALLCANDEFCAEFGRALLAVGRLESALIQYIDIHAPDENTTRATLGRLIKVAEKHSLLSKMLPALKTLKHRAIILHTIFMLCSWA